MITHVLANFSKAEIAWLKPLVDALVEAAPLLAKDDDAGFHEQGGADACTTQTAKSSKAERLTT